jgi:deoxyribodipyrimidine photo-lyase
MEYVLAMRFHPIEIPQRADQRLDFIAEHFPQHQGPYLKDAWRGGRHFALLKLAKINPEQYGRTRNFLDGSVTHLSPYLRHGCISLTEAIMATQKAEASDDKLLFEFAWRDYWRQVWYAKGHDIHHDMESPKVLLHGKALPLEMISGDTGLSCMDNFVRELYETGYLHNHARMWLASYIIHWLGVDWHEAADWMHGLLIDGDQASNSLSWQWIASTFSSKPYFFNKENLIKYSQNRYCPNCRASCPFDQSYDQLAEQLFQQYSNQMPVRKKESLSSKMNASSPAPKKGGQTIVLFHDEMLSSEHPLIHEPYQKVFIFDPEIYQGWSLHRLQFLADCLAEMPDIEVWKGPIDLVLEHLDGHLVITQRTPQVLLNQLLSNFQVNFLDEERIYPKEIQLKLTKTNLSRFSKYWNIVSPFYKGTHAIS